MSSDEELSVMLSIQRPRRGFASSYVNRLISISVERVKRVAKDGQHVSGFKESTIQFRSPVLILPLIHCDQHCDYDNYPKCAIFLVFVYVDHMA